MIATMAGKGVPVLEMFARFDAENPPPVGWDLWGNQAADNSQANAVDHADAGEAGIPVSPVEHGGADRVEIDARLEVEIILDDRDNTNPWPRR